MKITEKFKNIIGSRYVPYIIYTLFMIILHIVIKTDFGDDLNFIKVLGEWDLWPYLVHRYNTWSSRFIIEICMVTLPHAVTLWKIIDIAVMAWIAACFSLFFNKEKKCIVDWYIVLIMMSYPLFAMRTAGWIATTVNYSWCVAFGLLALVPTRNLLVGKKNPWYLYIPAFFGLFYASSHEQMCAVMVAISLVLGVYYFYKTRKVHWFTILQEVIALAGLTYILTCPGNANRTVLEIERWFPHFAEFSLFNKIELGYSRAMYEFVMKQNILYMLFCATLTLAVFVYNKNIFLRLVSVIPFAVSLLMGPFVSIVQNSLPFFERMRKALTVFGTGFAFASPRTWLPVLFVTAIAACIIISLWAVFKNTPMALFTIAVLGIGLATAVAMGFSPTVWASEERTFIFMYMAFAAVGVALFNHIQKAKLSKGANIVMIFYCAFQAIFAADLYLNLFYII